MDLAALITDRHMDSIAMCCGSDEEVSLKRIDDERCCEGIITHQETRGLGVEFLAEGHDVEAVLRW